MVKFERLSDCESAKSFSDFELDRESGEESFSQRDYIDKAFDEIANAEKSMENAFDEQKRRRNRVILLVFCSLGILVFYLIFGYAQESVTKQGFGEGFPNGPDNWTFMLALVWVRKDYREMPQ